MIKAIIFDLGNVILFYDHTLSCNKLAKSTKHTAQEIAEFIFDTDLKARFDRGEIEPSEFYSRISEKFGLNIPYTEFREIWGDIFWMNESITEIIHQLKEKYELYILSNTDAIHLPYFQNKFPILEEFDYLFTSCELKLSKPDLQIYKTVLEKIGLAGNECVYIDDAEEFINAGKQVGLNVILYKDITSNQLKKELAKYGIQL